MGGGSGSFGYQRTNEEDFSVVFMFHTFMWLCIYACRDPFYASTNNTKMMIDERVSNYDDDKKIINTYRSIHYIKSTN